MRKWNGSKWLRPDKRLALYLRDNLACVYCGATVESGAQLTADHVLPVALGGTNHEGNLVTCCLSCNSSKQDKTMRQWYAAMRTAGVDTAPVQRRVRRLLGKNLKPYRATAKRMLAERGTSEE